MVMSCGGNGKYICELGNEARLISMQLDELANVESHELLIMKIIWKKMFKLLQRKYRRD